MNLLTLYAVSFCGLWVFMFILLGLTLKTIPEFGEETKDLPAETETLPSLSVIIPARNEAANIETALKSVLGQDYPNLEIFVVNDRSSDTTGEVLARLAEKDSRLKILNIDVLPAGWLGKVNALNQGVSRAGGEWYLFTDADVRYEPGVFRRALRYARHSRIDHLVFLPGIICSNILLEIVMNTFGFLFLLSLKAHKVNAPGSKTPIGVGAFNLVRAEKFRETPGFEWLRLEPADDYGVGLMMNNAGGETRVVAAADQVSVPWYETLGEMFRGCEKNLFGPGSNYQWWFTIFQVVGLWALIAAPGVGLAAGIIGGSGLMLSAAGAAIAANLLLPLVFLKRPRTEVLSLLFFPVGAFLVSLMLINSAYRCLKNGGIDWRETHYSIEELRAGRRVKFWI